MFCHSAEPDPDCRGLERSSAVFLSRSAASNDCGAVFGAADGRAAGAIAAGDAALGVDPLFGAGFSRFSIFC